MTTAPLGCARIGPNVLPIETWNPQNADARHEFDYIDIASIDRDAKTIVSMSRISAASAPSRARQIVHSGDVLVSTVRPNLNAVALVPDQLSEAIASTGFCALRCNPQRLNFRYLFHWVRTPQFVGNMIRQATGASYPAVSDRIIKDSKVPLPPLSEQKRIADILDKADAIRRKQREAVATIKKFIHVVFLEMFARGIQDSASGHTRNGWCSTILDHIKASTPYSCIGGPFGSDLTASDYANEPGVPVIRGVNLSDDSPYMSEDGFVFVSDEKAKELRCSAFRGDIIVSQRGARLAGQVGLIREDSQFPVYVISQSQMKITVDLARVDPIFLVYYLQTAWAVREMERRTISTGVPHINLGILKSFPIHLPPRDLQDDFRRVWSRHTALLTSVSTGYRNSDCLFNSLVQRAFRGEL